MIAASPRSAPWRPEHRAQQGGLIDAERGWDGLLTVSGTLQQARDTATPLDSLEQVITDLRTGPAFVSPGRRRARPGDWSAIRRAKDNQGRYRAVDPLDGAANTVPRPAALCVVTGL